MTTEDRHLANVLGAVSLQVTTRTSAAMSAATGLSPVQVVAMVALANYADGGSTAQLGSSVDLSHSATVRLVDRLVQLGLVERRVGAGDGRVSAVHLTSQGRRVVGRIRRARAAALDEVLAGLGEDQRAALAPALDVLAAAEVAPAPDGIETSRYVCRLCDADACGHPDGCPVTRRVMGAPIDDYVQIAYNWGDGVRRSPRPAVPGDRARWHWCSPSPGRPARAAPASPPAVPGGGSVSGPVPQVYPPFDSPAGDPCPFPLHGTFPVNHTVGYFYKNAAGRTVAAYYTGALTMEVTRVDTGTTRTYDISASGVQTFGSDGSSTLYGGRAVREYAAPGRPPGAGARRAARHQRVAHRRRRNQDDPVQQPRRERLPRARLSAAARR